MGGVAPIREAEDALGGLKDEEAEAAAAADPWREFNNARGARGGALPDIDEHGTRERRWREGSQRDVDEVVVVGQAASPCDFAPWATSWTAVACGLVSPDDHPFLDLSFIALMKYAHIQLFPLFLLEHTCKTFGTAPHVVKLFNIEKSKPLAANILSTLHCNMLPKPIVLPSIRRT